MIFNIDRTIDVKLNVRMISLGMYHDYVFEGPCRFVSGEKLSKEWDMDMNSQIHQFMVQAVAEALPTEDVNLLEPMLIQYDESFFIKEEHLEEMGKDLDEVDLFLISAMSVGDMILELAHKFRKPIVVLGMCLNTIAPAALMARGYEIYPAETLADVARLVTVLKARKALAETKVLSLVRLNSNNAPAIMDSFVSLDEATRKFGTRFVHYNLHEFIDQMHNVPPGTNPTTPGRDEQNINDEDEAEIAKMTFRLIANASENDMTFEKLQPSVRAYYLANKIMERLDCNAFTAPCFDSCSTRRFNEERFTFCLNHSLNNERGVISACEYDMCSVLSMVALSCISKSGPYMGNCIPNPIKNGALQAFGEVMFNPESVAAATDELGDMENLVLTFHAVPNRKMKGFCKKRSPYAIRPFTGSGWGATLRYDFAEDVGREITMCRFGPDCRTLFVGRGRIVGGLGYTDTNCSEGVFFEVEDAR